MKSLTIIVNARNDYFLAKDSILAIKEVYKEVAAQPNILLITDGIHYRDLSEWCEFNGVDYLKGERLYLSNKGGEWIKRWLEEGIKYNTDWILRLDPDTRLFKPVPLKHEISVDVVSPYFPKDERLTRLHGSFQLIRRESAIKIIDSGICNDIKYKKPEFEHDFSRNVSERSWFKTNFDRSVAINEDLIFSDICETLEFKTKDALGFMNCWWREKPADDLLIKNSFAQHPYYKIDNIKSRVFGIGLSRTGTAALNNALNMIGVDSVHYDAKFKTNENIFKCIEFYQGYVDIPMPLIYKEMDELYQGSSFILTVRDVEKWLSSFKFHIKTWKEMQARTESMLTDEMRNNRLEIKEFWDNYSNKMYGVNSIQDSIDEPKIDYLLKNGYTKHCLDAFEYFEGKENLLILDVSEKNSFIKLANFMNTVAPERNIPLRNSKNEVINLVKDIEKSIIRSYNQRMKNKNQST